MTQSEIILKVLEEKLNDSKYSGQSEWIFAYDLRGKNTKWGFLGHQGDRAARSLAAKGLIERKLSSKGYAIYRAKRTENIKAELIPTQVVRVTGRLL